MRWRETGVDRTRLGWWLVVGALAAGVAYVVYSFVGTAVLGLFVYYAVRPADRRLRAHVDSRSLAAGATLVCVALPLVVLLAVVAVLALDQFGDAAPSVAEAARFAPVDAGQLRTLLSDPTQLRGTSVGDLQQALSAGAGVLGTVANALVHLFLVLALVYFLLRDGDRLAGWFRSEIAGPGTAAYGYLTAVDRDLETVYFGNVLTAALVTVLAAGVYHGLAAVSPPDLSVPFPTLLALLTGLATFVPLVVGKLVYVPVGAYLGLQASGSALWFPLAFLAVSFVLLDALPVMILRPFIAGRGTHSGLMMFGYIVGALLFGWYGLFLGPLFVVVVVQAVRIVVPELVHGEALTPEPTSARSLGSEPVSGGSDGGDDGSENV